MTQSGYALLGLTALVAALVGIVVFAMLRFMAAARDTRRHLRESGGETAFMAAALQEAMTRLKAQERAMAERAEASERLSSEIVASLTAGLLVVDLDGQVRILNPAGRRLLGLNRDQPPGPYQTALRHAQPLADVIEECLRTKHAIVRRALEMPNPGPMATHLGVTVSPLSDPDGQLHGAICLFTDLSVVMEMEEQLRLKDSLARVGELTAGIAHEFRNGLATIHGYSRLLDLETLPERYRPYVEGIRQETESLGQVMNNFLSFARPAQLTLSPVDLHAIAERTVEEVRTEAHARDGDIEIRGEFPIIEGDEVLLRQAFSNLLRNAVEACAAAQIRPAILVEGHVDHEGRTTTIAISDNGPGIDPSMRERIFTPFVTTKKQGTGLGLALVQKIIVTHNGRITAMPCAGGGATMQIVLPVSPSH